MRRALSALAALGLSTAAVAQAPNHVAMLAKAGGVAAGTVTLTPAPKGILLVVEVTGLTSGWHAIHLHEKGDCSDAAFKSAGAHVHMGTPAVHGLLNDKANDLGDLPNIWVAEDGTGHAELFTGLTTIGALMDKDGSAVVIHVRPDDHMTQPIGGAGDRVACGVVK